LFAATTLCDALLQVDLVALLGEDQQVFGGFGVGLAAEADDVEGAFKEVIALFSALPDIILERKIVERARLMGQPLNLLKTTHLILNLLPISHHTP
jgi:hypothetical protein